MKTTYDESRGYRIHLYKTDKFKQTTIKISLREPILKENITRRALLYNVLFSSSRKYNSERKINIRKKFRRNKRIFIKKLFNVKRII